MCDTGLTTMCDTQDQLRAQIATLENQLLAATIRIDNDARIIDAANKFAEEYLKDLSR